MTVRTRFAPSPTGALHIGGVRTALFSWLYARKKHGCFVLRIEDTDRERSTKANIEAILEAMAWLGLTADEGPHYQMERLDRYATVVAHWLEQGKAYRCYCTPEELEKMRAEQVSRGENPRYDGRCRSRPSERAGVEPAIRFRHLTDGQVIVHDLVRGDVTFENSQFDDFVIVRSDGVPTYNFAVVVDDSDMNITHVIRGDDHLNNTPKQMNLLAALGHSPPIYAHLPMILGPDGARLSKRHGAVNVLDYRDQGYLPAALINYLVRLGWSHGDQEIFSIDEMIELFDIGDINASASSFNPEKLKWLNQQYIIKAPGTQLTAELERQLQILGIDRTGGPSPNTVVEVYRERAATLRDMAESCRYCFEDFAAIDPQAAKKHLRPVILEPLSDVCRRFESLSEWTAKALEAEIDACAAAHDITMGKIGQPIRVAVTGGGVSPPIDATLALIGRERSIRRLRKAIEFIEDRATTQ
jgi:glutamyl-tRNA synthetase